MKITEVEVIPVTVPRKTFRDAHGAWSKDGKYDQAAHMGEKNYIIAKIHTDEDIIGLGEGSPIDPSFYGETQETMISVIKNYFAPMLIGKNPLNIESLMTPINQGFPGSACAKTALDMALHDITAKAFGVPVYTLLGGIQRDKVRVAWELSLERPEEMAQIAANHVSQGIKVLKLHIGTTPKEDLARIEAVREAVGDDVKLRVDANGAYLANDAIRMAKAAEKHDLQLIEQPVPRWDIEGLAKVRNSVTIPVEVDESVWTPLDVMNIIRNKAADIINVKLTRVGGFTNAKKMADVADAAYLQCIVGCEGEYGVGTAAKIQLGVHVRNMNMAGEFTELYTAKDHIIKNPFKIVDGFLQPRQAPGLGIELDEDKVKTYTTRL